MSGSVSAVVTAIEMKGQFCINIEENKYITLGSFLHQLVEDGGTFQSLGMVFDSRPVTNRMTCSLFVMVPVNTDTAKMLIPDLNLNENIEEKEND